jgi:hypothetical protein
MAGKMKTRGDEMSDGTKKRVPGRPALDVEDRLVPLSIRVDPMLKLALEKYAREVVQLEIRWLKASVSNAATKLIVEGLERAGIPYLRGQDDEKDEDTGGS